MDRGAWWATVHGVTKSQTRLSDIYKKNIYGKNRPASAGDGLDPWVRKIPWSRKWHPTPVFLPGEFHGQRSLVGYSPWGHKESDATEQLTLSLFIMKVKLII